MASTVETGHAKNVANFGSLTSYVLLLGTQYVPSKPSLKMEALQNTLTGSKKSLDEVTNALSAYVEAVSARDNAFAGLSKFVTRVMNALRATDTSARSDEFVRSLVRKIQGIRKSAKLTEEEKKALAEEGKEVNEKSASQMSYDLRLENYDKLVQHLSGVALYMPNEADLSIAGLTAYLNDLRARNSAVVNAGHQLGIARIARNEILYKPLTGLVDIAADAKSYIKSVFGATSEQYKQISKLDFITVN